MRRSSVFLCRETSFTAQKATPLWMSIFYVTKKFLSNRKKRYFTVDLHIFYSFDKHLINDIMILIMVCKIGRVVYIREENHGIVSLFAGYSIDIAFH